MFKWLKKTELNKLISPQWGIPMFLYLLVIVAMTSRFSAVTKRDVTNEVRNYLIQECNASMCQLNTLLDEAKVAAKGMAKVIGEVELNQEELFKCAEILQNAQEATYMVAIATDDGKAYTSFGEIENVADCPYYTKYGGIEFYILENDGITQQEAAVIAVPYYNNMVRQGQVLMFIERDRVDNVFLAGNKEYDKTYVLTDSEGNYLMSGGATSTFTKNSTYLENLEDVKITGSSYSRLSVQIASKEPFIFSAERDEEESVFVTVPVGVHNWRYTAIIDRDLYDDMISEKRKSSQGMVEGIGFSLLGLIIVVLIFTVLDRKKVNEQRDNLSQKADTDLLTGLNNKIATERKVQEYIERHPDIQGVFFMFDIDDFKKINDTQGHAFGDEVLRSLGNHITNEFRVSDIIGRTGGDEFIIFLKGIQTDEQVQKEARKLENFFKHFQVGEYVKYSATASIGAAVYSKDGKTYSELYKAADSALYEAKRQGKNRLVFYHENLQEVKAGMKKDKKIDSDE